jgi:hypothetical protein
LSAVDWAGLEPHYRAGLRPLKDLGAEFGVSDAGIIKHARKNGWTRDLKAKIAAQAEAKVSAAAVSEEVSKQRALTERDIVDANADAIVKVRLAHRKDIGKARSLAMQLMAELESQCDSAPLYEELLDLVIPAAEDEDSKASQDRVLKLRQAFDKAMSLGGRTKTMKDLADTLKTLVALEREAFNVGEAAPLPTDDESVDIPALARRIAFAFSATTRTMQ